MIIILIGLFVSNVCLIMVSLNVPTKQIFRDLDVVVSFRKFVSNETTRERIEWTRGADGKRLCETIGKIAFERFSTNARVLYERNLFI